MVQQAIRREPCVLSPHLQLGVEAGVEVRESEARRKVMCWVPFRYMRASIGQSHSILFKTHLASQRAVQKSGALPRSYMSESPRMAGLGTLLLTDLSFS